MQNRIRIAIIGTGNIGTDLCARMLRDDEFEVVAFVGRRENSPGIELFKKHVRHTITNGIDGLMTILDEIDGVFDATSAFDHTSHWELLRGCGKWVIDLTPSQIGRPMVPVLIDECNNFELEHQIVSNYSMITCGGQSSAPLIFAMSKFSKKIKEIEVSSSIASMSAGPATRKNIDEYIQSTENLVKLISGCNFTKAILVLNPSTPPVMMRTTVQMQVGNCDINGVINELAILVSRVKKYVPGYDVVVEPHFSKPYTISGTIKVTGAGFVLPEYSGNLDIINAAAVETARRHFKKFAHLARPRTLSK